LRAESAGVAEGTFGVAEETFSLGIMITQEQKQLLVELLEAGYRPAQIANKLNVKATRIYQRLDLLSGIDIHIPCHYCGRAMTFEWGRQHKYHSACAGLAQLEQQRGDKTHRQRRQPDGNFERLALAAYGQRGAKVVWMPWLCVFDYVVNGIRVDVKGSNIGKPPGRFYFALHNGQEMSSRCDVLHCIGMAGEAHHYIIPASAVGSLTQIAIPIASSYSGKWAEYKDNWSLLENSP